jgi:spore coat polysaccharide biosynthesis protein SpsF
MSQKVVAIIQAREGSERLPGKVLLPLGNCSVLERCYRACETARCTSKVVIATGSKCNNQKLFELCQNRQMVIYSGSDQNVLSRYVTISRQLEADVVIRVTADCPLLRPDLVDLCTSKLIDNNLEYCSLSDQFAEGVDLEVFTFNTLMKIDKLAQTAFAKEHVTYALHKNKHRFNLYKVDNKLDDSDIRITLDHPEDYLVLKEIFKNYENELLTLDYKELIILLRTEFKLSLQINQHIKRNETLNA